VDPKINQKWVILKYLSAEIFLEKTKYSWPKDMWNGILGQKLGYNKCPYLSFFVRRPEDEIFDSTSRRDLNTEYTIFYPKMLRVLVMKVWMQDDKGGLTGDRHNKRIPKIVKERDPTPLWDNAISLGKGRLLSY